MVSREIQYYKGKKYIRREGEKYFKSHRFYLHRVVWEDNFGEIPQGYHIHHIDHDRSNNRISNLQCIKGSKHMSEHSKGRKQNPQHHKKMVELAKVWHRSEEGRKWHKEHGIEAYKKRIPIVKNCHQCKNSFDDISRSNRTRFCSNKCKSAWRRKEKLDDIEKECPFCGTRFKTNKYHGSEYCTRSCSKKAYWETKRLQSNG